MFLTTCSHFRQLLAMERRNEGRAFLFALISSIFSQFRGKVALLNDAVVQVAIYGDSRLEWFILMWLHSPKIKSNQIESPVPLSSK